MVYLGSMQRNVELEATIVAKYAAVSPVLDERSRRRWAAAESVAIGYGGDALVSSATGLARETIRKGRREITQGGTPTGRIRRPGAGRTPSRTEAAWPPGRPGRAGGSADARRPNVSAALDMQESGEARLGAGTTRVASEFDDRGPVAISTGVPAAIGP